MTNEHTPLDAAPLNETELSHWPLDAKDDIKDFPNLPLSYWAKRALRLFATIKQRDTTIEAQAKEIATLRAREEVVARVACEQQRVICSGCIDDEHLPYTHGAVEEAYLADIADIRAQIEKEMNTMNEDNLDFWENAGWWFDPMPMGIVTTSPKGDHMFHADLPFNATVVDALKIHRDKSKEMNTDEQ